MTDLEKAARMALEALEQLQGGCTDSNDGTMEAITVWCPEVIAALRQALSDSVEPVDWEAVAADQAMTIAMMKAERKPWVGLTQQDIDIAFDDTQEGGGFDEFARAIEAKLKKKNTGETK